MMNHVPLPQRSGPRPRTNKNMPYSQIGVEPVPEVNAELFRCASSLPGVENRPTVISVPGARALWLDDGMELAHPEVVARDAEHQVGALGTNSREGQQNIVVTRKFPAMLVQDPPRDLVNLPRLALVK